MPIKIVISTCYGGFSVSEAGMRLYAEIKDISLWAEPDERFGGILPPTYWLVPPEARLEKSEDRWHEMSLKERQAYNDAYVVQTLSCREFVRHDPVLVEVVERLGPAASGEYAQLEVRTIEGNRYRVCEYDGNEWIETPDSIEWTVTDV